MLITKSLFVEYLSHPKMAWWKHNKTETYDWIKKSDTVEAKEHIIQLGQTVEDYVKLFLEEKYDTTAIDLFEEIQLETDDEFEPPVNFEDKLVANVNRTIQAIKDKEKLLYQPWFFIDGCYVRGDFMVLLDNGQYALIEVKAKSAIRKTTIHEREKFKNIGKVEDQFVHDISFQKHIVNKVLEQEGISPIEDFHFCYLNHAYIYGGWKHILSQLITHDILKENSWEIIHGDDNDRAVDTSTILLSDTTIEGVIKKMKAELSLQEDQFNQLHPFTGGKYVEYFGEEKPFGTVLAIPGLHHSKFGLVASLFKSWMVNLTELDGGIIWELGNKAAYFVNHYLQSVADGNSPIIKSEEIKKLFDQYFAPQQYPICFYDYETVNVPIPFIPNSRPYQQVVVQYSLHKVYADGTMKHYGGVMGGLSDDKRVELIDIDNNPNKVDFESEKVVYGAYKDLLDEFVADIGEDIHQSTFVVWYKHFENTRNKEIANTFHQLTDTFEYINERTFDLMEVFSKLLYFDTAFKGSSSIKKVLPVLVPEMTYEGMNIGKGDIAARALANVMLGTISDKNERATILKDLLLYCGQDSLAMVRIWERIISLTNWD